MENTLLQLLSLPGMAEALHLPKEWLQAEADAGRIPHLRIGKRYRFNYEAVVYALAELLRKSVGDGLVMTEVTLSTNCSSWKLGMVEGVKP